MPFQPNDPVVLKTQDGDVPAGERGCVIEHPHTIVTVRFETHGIKLVHQSLLDPGEHRCSPAVD